MRAVGSSDVTVVEHEVGHPTPLLPARSAVAEELDCATLTIMTGSDAGRVVSLERREVVVGRGPQANVRVDDPHVSRRHARLTRCEDGSFYVEDLGSRNGTFLGEKRVTVTKLTSGDYLQLGPGLRVRFEVTDGLHAALRQHMYESSVRDSLTHLSNRRYLTERLTVEVAHARRTDGEVSLLMIDIDHFKEFNDRHGHIAGDRLLCLAAHRMLKAIRVEDVLARFGGDEFVLLARATPGDHAARLAERLRRAVEELRFSSAAHAPVVTVSIGLASLTELDPHDAPAALLALADERLYGAKLRGRNQVCANT